MTHYLITGARLVDPRQDSLGPAVNVLVKDGLVTAVSTESIQEESAKQIDAQGLTVMPGLIDAHVHMFMNELNIGALAAVPQTYTTAKATMVLRQMLARGFTAVRDVAGGDYGMRDAAEAGYIESPRLFVGGKAISQTGGHGDFRGRAEEASCACCTGLALFSTLADGVPEVIKATREQLRLGADHIKIMLSGGVASPNDPLDSIQYRTDEIAACVEEAQRWGSYVCAHAYADTAIRRGVVNGIRTIEHGNFVSAETAAMMPERNCFVVPTPMVHEANHRLGAASGKTPSSMEKNERVRLAALQSLKVYRTAGVPIGYGTDLSMHTQHFQNEGFQLLATELTNAEVIRSATLTNARILRQEGILGELVVGAKADLLLLRGNPFEDISILARTPETMVAGMKGGEFFRNGLPASARCM